MLIACNVPSPRPWAGRDRRGSRQERESLWSRTQARPGSGRREERSTGGWAWCPLSAARRASSLSEMVEIEVGCAAVLLVGVWKSNRPSSPSSCLCCLPSRCGAGQYSRCGVWLNKFLIQTGPGVEGEQMRRVLIGINMFGLWMLHKNIINNNKLLYILTVVPRVISYIHP